MTSFLIIRGPLGAGKTTIARAVALALAGETIAIDPILERWEWDGGSESLFLKANQVAAEQALPLLERRVPVVFVGNFYWKSAIEDLQGRLPFPNTVFTLKVPLELCVERDRGRELSYGEENTREVFEKVTRFEAGTTVDGTLLEPQVVKEITRPLLLHGQHTG